MGERAEVPLNSGYGCRGSGSVSAPGGAVVLEGCGHVLFETAIGVCGIAWSRDGVAAVQLPERNETATRERLVKGLGRCPPVDAPPAFVVQATAGIQALLQCEHRDLLEVRLETTRLTTFQRRVYAIARSIPPGRTRTYVEVALELGDVKLARAVGQALGHNPFAPVVPCHRVLAAGNRPGGFSATGGAATKLRMLAIEGAVLSDTLPLFNDA